MGLLTDIVCKNCGSVNDYVLTEAGPHSKATCASCDKFIKFIPQGNPYIFYFGKYKDRLLTSMTTKEEIEYVKWLHKQPRLQHSLCMALEGHLTTMGAPFERRGV